MRHASLVMLPFALIASHPLAAAPVTTNDGLTAEADGATLHSLALAGDALAGVAIEAVVIDPHTAQPAAEGFTVSAQWVAQNGLLRLEGEVRAEGEEDRVADLIIRVRGVEVPLSSMSEEPLLLPRALLSKLPLVSLRTGAQDALALAVPPDRLALFEFRIIEGGVELRFPFGFTREARPELQMRAPFACVIYRTDPRWRFRSALRRYYTLFPEPFEPFIREPGGWFFAAPVPDLPNPQHFHYWEGGPGGWEEAKARGLGTYPYRESSSYTVSLPGSELPKSYEEAMERFDALAQQIVPAAWTPQQAMEIVQDVKLSGERSLLADSGETGHWTGARQAVTLDPPFDGPILVRGHSRAENVAGARDNSYSVYVDVVYEDGSYLFGQCATFTTRTHDWEESRHLIQPAKPVAELRVYCLLRGKTGRAWFDDIHVGPADEPEVNWLLNPGFEELERRRDLQYIRDNVCINSRGEYVVSITDNLSSDVAPTTPMNLLRFTLNLDPDIPSTEERPAVAAGEFDRFDRIFRELPEVAGCYIDSVSAWVYRVLNFRREHWPYNSAPFSYDPGTRQVAAVGRFAMVKYLRALQERYHPLGKPIFTNIHVNPDAFPVYLVSDVPGIESSRYRDEDALFFYRASSFQKPLLLMNFINLHGLDQRDLAEAFHLNAAQWGELPSTGRLVQQAYRDYGDVTHAYMPSIKELAAAGWQPVPLAEGMRVERFGEGEAVYFTLRAPATAAGETLRILPEALAGMGDDLVAFDTVQLRELPLVRAEDGFALTLTHGASQLTIVRISPREAVAEWLLERARAHALHATRVQGTVGVTPELAALHEALSRAVEPEGIPAMMAPWQDALQAALDSVVGPEEDLFALSRRREVLQAAQALAALNVFLSGHSFELTESVMTVPGRAATIAAVWGTPRPGFETRLVRLETVEGRQIAPDLEPITAASLETRESRVTPTAPGTIGVRAAFHVQRRGERPWTVHRLGHVFALPAAELEVKASATDEEARSFEVNVTRRDAAAPEVVLEARVLPEGAADPPPISLGADRATAVFRVRRVDDGRQRTLEVIARDAAGNELARASGPSFYDEPPAPEGDLALASLGATVTTDTSYGGGYSPEPLIDGLTQVAGLHWTRQAWASRDSREPHWLEVILAEPAHVGRVWLYWAIDGARVQCSRSYTVIGLTDDGPVELASVEDGPTGVTVSRHEFEPVVLRGVRVEQPSGGGPQHRPNIMWLREVCMAR